MKIRELGISIVVSTLFCIIAGAQFIAICGSLIETFLGGFSLRSVELLVWPWPLLVFGSLKPSLMILASAFLLSVIGHMVGWSPPLVEGGN